MSNTLVQYASSSNAPTFNVDITSGTILVVAVLATTNGDGASPATASLNGVSGTKIGGTTFSGGTESNIAIFEFTTIPTAGSYPLAVSATGSLSSVLSMYEFTDKSSVEVGSYEETDYGNQVSPFTTNFVRNNASGKSALITLACSDAGYGNTAALPTLPVAIDGISDVSRYTKLTIVTGVDTSVATNTETYSTTFTDDLVNGYMGHVTGTSIVLVDAPNTAPIADDTGFTLFSNTPNSTEVGTFTATDNDGYIASYSIDGTVFGINNSGVITVIDSASLVVGTMTATVTSTDNDGAQDTALVTFTVEAPRPSILTVTPVVFGTSVTVTVDSVVDLSSALSVTATYGGITVNLTNITANSFNFTAPSGGIELGAQHDLIVTADSGISVPSNNTYLPPSGYSFVTLSGVHESSWLANSAYTGNAGGDINNIGVGDQIVYQNSTIELATSVILSDTGIIEMPNAVDDGVVSNQTITWFYLEAQESYDASNVATLTLELPNSSVIITSFGQSGLGTNYFNGILLSAKITDSTDSENVIITEFDFNGNDGKLTLVNIPDSAKEEYQLNNAQWDNISPAPQQLPTTIEIVPQT